MQTCLCNIAYPLLKHDLCPSCIVYACMIWLNPLIIMQEIVNDHNTSKILETREPIKNMAYLIVSCLTKKYGQQLYCAKIFNNTSITIKKFLSSSHFSLEKQQGKLVIFVSIFE